MRVYDALEILTNFNRDITVNLSFLKRYRDRYGTLKPSLKA
jgi:hypothetical protein